MTSKRLPKKAIQKINGENSLTLVIRRIKKIKNIDEIILATSTHELSFKKNRVFQRLFK